MVPNYLDKLSECEGWTRNCIAAPDGVNFDVFLEAVFGLAPEMVANWSSIINQQKWCEDKTVARALEELWVASYGESKHIFPDLVNRIMELAHGRLPGVPDMYPVMDICVKMNTFPYVLRKEGDTRLGTRVMPDLFTLRREHAKDFAWPPMELKEGARVPRWTNVIMSWELKSSIRLNCYYDRFWPAPEGRQNNRYSPDRYQDDEPMKPPAEDDIGLDIRDPHVYWRSDQFFCPDSTVEDTRFVGKWASMLAGMDALHTLACSFGTRLFCVNAVIRNDRLYLWYYDSEGIVYTKQSLSFMQDFNKFAAVMVGIACATPEQLGKMPPVIIAPRPTRSTQWPPESLAEHTLTMRHPKKGKIRIVLREPVYSMHSIDSRRTFAYTAKISPVISRAEVLIRFSYQVSIRKHEYTVVRAAQKAGVEHLPTIHMCGDLWRNSYLKGVREMFYRKCGVECSERVLRAVIYPKYLPLESLVPHSPESIPIMAYQILDCLHDLRYKMNLLHSDINVDNIVYEYRGDRLYFVLIDFDTAISVSNPNRDVNRIPSRGSLMFTAEGLLREIIRQERNPKYVAKYQLCHTYESLYWVCLYCTLVYVPADDLQHRWLLLEEVRSWETEWWQLLMRTKSMIRTGCGTDDWSREFTFPQRAIDVGLFAWFWAWAAVWSAHKTVMDDSRSDDEGDGRPNPDFDLETCGGLITRDVLKSVLTQVLPDPYNPPLPDDMIQAAMNTLDLTEIRKNFRANHAEEIKDLAKAAAKAKAEAAQRARSSHPPKKVAATKKTAKKAKLADKKARSAPGDAVVGEKRAANADGDSGTRKRLRSRK